MSEIKFPFTYIPDPDKGRPVFNGNIYIGKPCTDPQVESNQIDVYYIDSCCCDGTPTLISQPIKTNRGGVPVGPDGDPVQLVLLDDQPFSMTITNKKDEIAYHVKKTSGYLTSSEADNKYIQTKTLSEVINDPGVEAGQYFIISDRGNGLFEIVNSSGVTPNGYNIIICDNAEFSLKLVEKTFNTPQNLGHVSGQALTNELLNALYDIGQADFGGSGITYKIDNPIVIENKTAISKASGCRFEISYNTIPTGFTPLTFRADYLNEQVVSNNTVTTFDFGGGTTQVTRLTVANASLYNVGDFVKVVSEDLISGIDPSLNKKKGESHLVGSIDLGNNYIYLLSTLRETYTTNVRIFKYNADLKVEWNGKAVFTGRDGYSGTSRNEIVFVEGHLKPEINDIEAITTLGEFLSFRGCYGASSLNIKGKDLSTSQAGNYFGYVIVERSCGYGKHVNPEGKNCRHVYTDGGGQNPDLSDPQGYGRNENCDVYNLKGINCQNAAADTHPEAYGCTFHNPVAHYPYRGQDGALWCVQLRGISCNVINPVSYGGDAVVIRATYTSPDSSRSHRIVNPVRRRKNFETNQSAPIRVLGVSGGRVSDIIIESPLIDIRNDDGPVFECEHADVKIINPTTIAELEGNSTGRMFNLIDSVVEVDGGFTDLTNSGGTNIRFCKLADDTSNIKLFNHRITKGSADLEYLADFSNANGTCYFVNLTLDDKPNQLNSVNNGGSQEYRISYTDGFGVGDRSGYINTVKTTNFSLNGINVDKVIDDTVIVAVDSSGAAGDINCTAIPFAGLQGQKLRLMNEALSSNNIVLLAGATNVAVQSNITIASGRSYDLVFDGSLWRG